MMTVLVTCAWAVLAIMPPEAIPQNPAPPQGFDDPLTYEVVKRGADDPIYVFVRDRSGILELYPDTPWQRATRVDRVPSRDVVSKNPEGENRRRERLKRGFDQAGYVLVSGYWLPARDVELSRKAHELYAHQLEHTADIQTADAAPDIPHVESRETDPATPSPVARWGIHAVIGLAAIGLIVLVTKSLVLAP